MLEKVQKETDSLTVAISRIEKDLNSSNAILPTYESSAIKCSGSAILLRFVENFKVRKHGTKTG